MAKVKERAVNILSRWVVRTIPFLDPGRGVHHIERGRTVLVRREPGVTLRKSMREEIPEVGL